MTSVPTHSCIYDGTVTHRRRTPAEHSFAYPISLLYLDLDELPTVFDVHPLWSARRAAPGRIRRGDLLGGPGVRLQDAVRDAVEGELGRRPSGAIRLLTTPRTFGHAFNPVSFYYCFDPGGTRIDAVVADVTNTPWGERHAYVMDPGADGSDKVFHVSPFMTMDHRYRWRFSAPAAGLVISISSDRDGERVFDASLRLERTELDRRALTRLLLRRPVAGRVTLARIYAQALALKLKGVPYVPHPDPPIPKGSR